MTGYDAVREAAKRAGMPLSKVAQALGLNTNYVSNGASRGSSPQANTLASMLNVCGYELCAVPRDEVTEQMFVIDGKQ